MSSIYFASAAGFCGREKRDGAGVRLGLGLDLGLVVSFFTTLVVSLRALPSAAAVRAALVGGVEAEVVAVGVGVEPAVVVVWWAGLTTLLG